MSLDFDTLSSLIKSDSPHEHLAVDQLGDQLIMVSEFNVGTGGEHLEYTPEQNRDINSRLHDLIEKECIVVRDRPLGGLDGFQAKSMLPFFDVWRADVDGERKEENKAHTF